MIAIQYAATVDRQPASLAEARQLSHDKLIRDLGIRRRSGVTWVTYDAPEGLRKLRELGHDSDPEHDALCVFLREHPEGALVAATAEAFGGQG